MMELLDDSSDLLVKSARFLGFLPVNHPGSKSCSIFTKLLIFFRRLLLWCVVVMSLGAVASLFTKHMLVLVEYGRSVTTYLILASYLVSRFGFPILVIAFAVARSTKLAELWNRLRDITLRLGLGESEFRQIRRRNSIVIWAVIVLTLAHAVLGAALGESWIYKFNSWNTLSDRSLVFICRFTYIYPYVFTALVIQMCWVMEKVLLKHKILVAGFFQSYELCHEDVQTIPWSSKEAWTEDVKQLDSLRRLHCELVNIANVLQNHFSWPILFQVPLTICDLMNGSILMLTRVQREAYSAMPQLILENLAGLMRLILILRAGDGLADKMVCVKDVLENVPTFNLSILLQLQLQQFLNKVQTKHTAWSAMGFFKIQRNLLPSVLGCVVTYFLINYQYHIVAGHNSSYEPRSF